MGKTLVYGLVALSAVFWGANFNLAGPVLAEMAPAWAGAGRFLVAAAALGLILAWRRESLRMPNRRGLLAYAGLGILGVGGFNLLFFAAMTLTSPINGALIMATNPLVTALLAWLALGERPSVRVMLALPVALLGVSLVISGGDPARMLALSISAGDGLMLAANLCWAGYTVAGRRLLPVVGGLADSTAIMAVGAGILTLAALAQGAPVTLPGPAGLSALLAMGLLGSVLAYLFWNEGIKTLGAGRTALFLNLVPVSTMILSAATGTAPSGLQLAGGGLVILAVLAATAPLPALTSRPTNLAARR